MVGKQRLQPENGGMNETTFVTKEAPSRDQRGTMGAAKGHQVETKGAPWGHPGGTKGVPRGHQGGTQWATSNQ